MQETAARSWEKGFELCMTWAAMRVPATALAEFALPTPSRWGQGYAHVKDLNDADRPTAAQSLSSSDPGFCTGGSRVAEPVRGDIRRHSVDIRASISGNHGLLFCLCGRVQITGTGWNAVHALVRVRAGAVVLL